MEEMQMKDQILIGLTIFEADYGQKKWVSETDTKNVIPFSAFQSEGAGNAAINYDKHREQLITSDNHKPDFNRYNIPEILMERPFANDEKLIAKLNAQGAQNDFLVIDKDFRNRYYMGLLPEVLLGNDRWTVDGYMGQLRLVKEPWKTLDVEELFRGESDNYQLIYDSKRHRDVTREMETALAMPCTWRHISIPNIYEMDPLGACRRTPSFLCNRVRGETASSCCL
ncbi:hypothetical protein [Pedobacter paludis]|uniref:Uncharacterized protein n=1 Tax=Pedobacter paludis TaxID=2203212 RepID=A0A317F0A6_9SPHI|nr:hypothetical protein [Pedobacter paludis]PWS32195.1 hypothetical protein DF947_10525 [Pedobacter paludis]